jgi:hypothetical protein
MATSSITANFYCNDAKAANAFVRMLAQPVKTGKRNPKAVHAHEFASGEEALAFCQKTVEVARQKLAEKRRSSRRRLAK